MTAWCSICEAVRPHDELETDHRGGLCCPRCGTRVSERSTSPA